MVANMWKIVKKYSKRYFIDAMSYMALGLFASLLIGTIIGAIADIPFLGFLKNNLVINGVTYKEGIVGIIKSSYVCSAHTDRQFNEVIPGNING